LRRLAGLLLLSLLLVLIPVLPVAPTWAAPGVCVGPVCADEISRSAKHNWQLRLRVSDQHGQHERLVVDCRNGGVSPLAGPVERGYAAAVVRRACRLAGETPRA
jgi:hypothetical protein